MRLLALLAMLLIQAQPAVRTGTISGQIRLREGAPAAGIRVSAQDVAESQVLIALAETDSEGRYRLQNVPPGRYRIVAGPLQYATYYPGVRDTADARLISVSAGASHAGINFTLAYAQAVRVSGRVPDLPASLPPGSIVAELTSSETGDAREAEIQADGTFQFNGVSLGAYSVSVRRTTGSRTPIAFLRDTSRAGGAGMWDTRSSINATDDVTDVVVPMAPIVVGQVRVEGGGALPQGRGSLSIVVQWSGARSRIVDVTGMFGLVLPPGEYRIAPLSLPFGYYIKEMSSGNVDLLRSPLIVTKGKPPEIQMTLSRTAPDSAPPRATVSGRVTGLPAGAGASPLALVLNEVPPDSVGTGQLPAVQHVGEASLTPDGEFQFREVPPGTYALFLFQQNEPFGDLPVRLTVNGQDLNGLEIRATVQGITLPPPELPEPRQPSAALLLPVTTGDDDVGLRIAVPEKWVFSNGAGFEADNRRLGATSYLVECKPIELNIGGIGTLGSECSRGHYLAHLSKQMLPGEIQLNISAGSSSGRVGDENMPADTVGLDLPSLLSAAALRPTGEPALASLRVSFAKRGFIWEILVYAKGAISEGDTKDLKAMLASLQFIDGPVSSEHWAAHLAWQQLPADERKPEVCWTIPHGMCGGRHVNVTKEESTYLVTFENRELPNNPTWKFRVEEAAGKVSRVP